MALVIADRVKETTTTAGTGTVTLAGAVTGYQSFSVIGNGNTTYYTIAGQNTSEWEVGIGTYTSSGTTLSRDTVLASSNSGSLVVFSSGTKDVFVTYPAGKAIYTNGAGTQIVATGALQVGSGGTGLTSTTAYAVLAGGTTSTGALQSVSGTGTSGQVLTSNGASALPTWQNAASGGGPTYITSNTTATSGSIYYTDTSAGAFTLTLPSSPSNGAVVQLFDCSGSFGVYPLTVSASQNIGGLSGSLICNVQGQYLGLQYVSASTNWRLL